MKKFSKSPKKIGGSLYRNIFLIILLACNPFLLFAQGNSCSNNELWGKITDRFPLTNSVSGATYEVISDLEIDKTFTFTTCTLYVRAGVSIAVIDGTSGTPHTLTIQDDSYVTSCEEEMWEGIDLINDYCNVSILDGTTIEDAVNGIYTENLGEIVIDYSEFNRNFRHVFINTGRTGFSAPSAAWAPSITHSVFVTQEDNSSTKCTGCLLSPHEEEDPELGIFSSAYGSSAQTLEIENCTVDNAKIGIYCDNNFLSMLDNKIYDCDTGVVIRWDSHVTWTSTTAGVTSIIDDCEIGIVCRASNPQIKIHGVAFSDGFRGFWSHQKGILNYGEITDCTFNNYTSIGIFAFENLVLGCNNISPPCSLKINNNEFDNIGNIAVIVGELRAYPGVDYKITNNNFGNVGNGIVAFKLVSPEIVNNTGITANTGMKIGAGVAEAWTYFGILAFGCIHPKIADNHVTSNSANKCNPGYIGINVVNTDAGRLLCNETENVGSGIKFEGVHLVRPWAIQRNVFGEAKYAFHLYNVGQGLGTLGKAPGGGSSGAFWDNE